MKYFVCCDDAGYMVRAANDVSTLPDPLDWVEVSDIGRHVQTAGLKKLHAGRYVLFTAQDQSSRDFAALLVARCV